MDSSLELPQNEVKKEEAGTTAEETKMEVEESTDKKAVVKDVATKAAKKPTVGAGKSDAIKSMFAKVKVEETTDKPVTKDVATKAAKKPTVGAGKSDAIKSMFAKAPPKKERVPEEKSEKSDSPGKENKASQESSSTTNKPDTKSQKVNGKTTSSKRRKRIQMMSDSDSSDNEETEHNNDYHEPVSELFKKNLVCIMSETFPMDFCLKCMQSEFSLFTNTPFGQMRNKTATATYRIHLIFI